MRFNWIRWLALAVDWNQRLDDENGVIGVGHFLWSPFGYGVEERVNPTNASFLNAKKSILIFQLVVAISNPTDFLIPKIASTVQLMLAIILYLFVWLFFDVLSSSARKEKPDSGTSWNMNEYFSHNSKKTRVSVALVDCSFSSIKCQLEGNRLSKRSETQLTQTNTMSVFIFQIDAIRCNSTTTTATNEEKKFNSSREWERERANWCNRMTFTTRTQQKNNKESEKSFKWVDVWEERKQKCEATTRRRRRRARARLSIDSVDAAQLEAFVSCSLHAFFMLFS